MIKKEKIRLDATVSDSGPKKPRVTPAEEGQRHEDHHRRRARASQRPAELLQLLRRLIDHSSNFVFDLCAARISHSAVPLATSTENGQRLARMLASRSVGGWGFHTLAGSAMR